MSFFLNGLQYNLDISLILERKTVEEQRIEKVRLYDFYQNPRAHPKVVFGMQDRDTRVENNSSKSVASYLLPNRVSSPELNKENPETGPVEQNAWENLNLNKQTTSPVHES